MYMRERLASQAPYLLSVVRVVVALLFIEHGSMKLLGFPPSDQFANLKLLSLGGLALAKQQEQAPPTQEQSQQQQCGKAGASSVQKVFRRIA